MSRLFILSTVMVCLIFVGSASAQQGTWPRIGYIYPAGSRQGAELEVVIGGRNLAGVATAYVSGTGIETFAALLTMK